MRVSVRVSARVKKGWDARLGCRYTQHTRTHKCVQVTCACNPRLNVSPSMLPKLSLPCLAPSISLSLSLSHTHTHTHTHLLTCSLARSITQTRKHSLLSLTRSLTHRSNLRTSIAHASLSLSLRHSLAQSRTHKYTHSCPSLTHTQAQPSDAYCVAYNRVRQLLERAKHPPSHPPSKVEDCSYVASGYYGTCVCPDTYYRWVW